MAFVLTGQEGCDEGCNNAYGPAGQGPPEFNDVVLAGEANCGREGLPILDFRTRPHSGLMRIDRSTDDGVTWQTIVDRRTALRPYLDASARPDTYYKYRMGAYWAVANGTAFAWSCTQLGVTTRVASRRIC
jgi:hypothetical protein